MVIIIAYVEYILNVLWCELWSACICALDMGWNFCLTCVYCLVLCRVARSATHKHRRWGTPLLANPVIQDSVRPRLRFLGALLLQQRPAALVRSLGPPKKPWLSALFPNGGRFSHDTPIFYTVPRAKGASTTLSLYAASLTQKVPLNIPILHAVSLGESSHVFQAMWQ